MRRTQTRPTTLALTLALLAAATLAPAAVGTATAQSQQTVTVSGAVTVAGGSSDGDRITVTPLTQNLQRAGEPVQTTVGGGSFSATGVTKAAMYFVRLEHDGAAHYRLASRTEGVTFRLGPSLSGRVVTPDGDPVANQTLLVQSPLGPPVTRVATDANGSFTAGPMRPNETYTVSALRAGVPYRWQVGTNETNATLVARDPSANESLLVATGGNPASHVVQVLPPKSGDGHVVIETVTLHNTGDRPFVGGVTVRLPANASQVEARYQNTTVPTRRVDGSVRINATVASNATTRVAVRYTVPGDTVAKPIGHDTDRVAVVLQGYNVSRVASSPNLAPGDSPIPLLTNDAPLSAGDRISVTLPPEARGSSGSDGQSGASGSMGASGGAGGSGERMPEFPTPPLVGGLVVTVAGTITAYRVF